MKKKVSKEVFKEIRQEMTKCGVWESCMNMKFYTTDEFISEFGDEMPDRLKTLLRQNYQRIQKYCDERNLEPINI